MVGPTNVIPAFFRALLRASDSDVLCSSRYAQVRQQQQQHVTQQQMHRSDQDTGQQPQHLTSHNISLTSHLQQAGHAAENFKLRHHADTGSNEAMRSDRGKQNVLLLLCPTCCCSLPSKASHLPCCSRAAAAAAALTLHS